MVTLATVPTDALPRPSKRKNDEDVRPSDTKVAKRKTALSTESLARNQPGASKKRAINQAPTQRLHAYVCGDVSAGELGLGPRIKKAKRPYLNPHLSGAVQVAVGGMHALALTHDNQILSWGVNDMGALGRDTTWDGGLVDIDDQSVESDDEMNPLESTPAAIPKASFPENTVITQVAAADSCSFALTEDGSVFGWGTFRVSVLFSPFLRTKIDITKDNEGCVGFAFDKQKQLIKVQRTPIRLPMLTGITQIACGSDHALALDKLGRVYAWGNGQQNQLGRRILERTKMQALVPCKVSIPRTKIVSVGCGSYHSFAIDQNGDVWGWGINSHGELGIPTQEDNEASRSIAPPQRVESLRGKRLESVQGGSNHSVGVTSNGECFVWGRADGGQCGLDVKSLPDDSVVRDMRGNVRMVSVPTVIPGKPCLLEQSSSQQLTSF